MTLIIEEWEDTLSRYDGFSSTNEYSDEDYGYGENPTEEDLKNLTESIYEWRGYEKTGGCVEVYYQNDDGKIDHSKPIFHISIDSGDMVEKL